MDKIVSEFAIAMIAKLEKNEYKGGWSQESLDYLMMRLAQEWAELADAIEAKDQNAIQDEAIDVANFAMMIFTNAWRAKLK